MVGRLPRAATASPTRRSRSRARDGAKERAPAVASGRGSEAWRARRRASIPVRADRIEARQSRRCRRARRRWSCAAGANLVDPRRLRFDMAIITVCRSGRRRRVNDRHSLARRACASKGQAGPSAWSSSSLTKIDAGFAESWSTKISARGLGREAPTDGLTMVPISGRPSTPAKPPRARDAEGLGRDWRRRRRRVSAECRGAVSPRKLPELEQDLPATVASRFWQRGARYCAMRPGESEAARAGWKGSPRGPRRGAEGPSTGPRSSSRSTCAAARAFELLGVSPGTGRKVPEDCYPPPSPPPPRERVVRSRSGSPPRSGPAQAHCISALPQQRGDVDPPCPLRAERIRG